MNDPDNNPESGPGLQGESSSSQVQSPTVEGGKRTGTMRQKMTAGLTERLGARNNGDKKSNSDLSGPSAAPGQSGNEQNKGVPPTDLAGKPEGNKELSKADHGYQQKIAHFKGKFQAEAQKVSDLHQKVAQYSKAMEVMQAQMERLQGFAQLDPKDEQINLLQVEKEIGAWSASQPQGQYLQDMQREELIADQVAEIRSQVDGLTRQYSLVDPREILLAAQADGETRTLDVIARTLHMGRLEKAKLALQSQSPQITPQDASQARRVAQPVKGWDRSKMRSTLLDRIAAKNSGNPLK